MVDYPAASKYAVGVGGTVITTDPNKHGVRQSETSWTFTGGGSSFFIQEPAYQKPVKNVSMPCLSQPDGTPYAGMVTCRGIPDVATLSGNVLGNGYFIYIDGQPSSEGGTSLSSPLMMGIWARIQAASTAARGVGFANPTIYRLGTTHYAKDFYDVTSEAESWVEDQLLRGDAARQRGVPARPGLGLHQRLRCAGRCALARRRRSPPCRGARSAGTREARNRCLCRNDEEPGRQRDEPDRRATGQSVDARHHARDAVPVVRPQERDRDAERSRLGHHAGARWDVRRELLRALVV